VEAAANNDPTIQTTGKTNNCKPYTTKEHFE
jgi:hypothetical protein